jgi:ATP-dependent DNA helicase RecQ
MAELRDGHCIEIDAEKESSEEPHWKLTDTGRETMRGKSKILLTFLPRGGGQTDETSDATDSLFQNLRIWRRTEAERQGVGAYIIFHDSALRTIAQTRPSSMQELAELPGVGQKRAERYGSEVLGICKAVRNCSGGAR